MVGSDTFCLGFKLAGVAAAYEMEKSGFPGSVDDIVMDEDGVVIVEGEYMDTLSERKRLELQNKVDPVVIPIREEMESTDLRRKIQQAIGVDLWQDD